MIALLTGFLAGSAHVWVGPDHLAAIAPVAAERTTGPWKTGIRWGLGHSAGVALVGALALGMRDALPLEAIAAWSEQLVGVMLVGIGIWTLRKAVKLTIHVHEHDHDGSRHVHIHAHTRGQAHASSRAHAHSHVPIGIGVLHGLAGSSHFLGVLPMLALPNTTAAVTYLTAFAAGTIASMGVFSTLVGLASNRCNDRGGQWYRAFVSLCGLAALGVGAAWLGLGVHGS